MLDKTGHIPDICRWTYRVHSRGNGTHTGVYQPSRHRYNLVVQKQRQGKDQCPERLEDLSGGFYSGTIRGALKDAELNQKAL